MDKLEQIKGELLSSLSQSGSFYFILFFFLWVLRRERKKKELGAKGRSKALDCTNRGKKKKKKKFFLFPSFVVCTFFFFSCSFLSFQVVQKRIER